MALAEPEADPGYYYSNGVYTYKAHTALPVVPVAAPAVRAAAFYNPLTYYNYYNPYVVPAVKTVEAPAEAETKTEEVVEAKTEEKVVAPIVYNVPNVYAPYAPYYAAPVATTVLKTPAYYANSAGVIHTVAKREAEAEADPSALYYAGAYGYPYAAYAGAYAAPYRYGYAGYPYGYAGYRYF